MLVLEVSTRKTGAKELYERHQCYQIHNVQALLCCYFVYDILKWEFSISLPFMQNFLNLSLVSLPSSMTSLGKIHCVNFILCSTDLCIQGSILILKMLFNVP